MSRQLFIQYLKTKSKIDHFRFYIYAYLRDKDSQSGMKGTPYYIGKGCGNRAWAPHNKVPVPKDLFNIIIISYDLSELWSLSLERRMISWYGRKNNNTGILLNMTDGGDGVSGYKWSEEQRKAKSGENHHTHGKIYTDEEKRRNGIALKGRKLSEEQIRNQSEANRKKTPIRCIELDKSLMGQLIVLIG